VENLDKAIAEVRAVREHDEELLRIEQADKNERLVVAEAFENLLKLGQVNGILSVFMAGWVGGREYERRVGGND